jgi:hypothetical protein
MVIHLRQGVRAGGQGLAGTVTGRDVTRVTDRCLNRADRAEPSPAFKVP